ncbi:MAG: metalloregulator ArsR/SmtB family transcription factor [Gammaproteobacteria bacterium]
MAAKSVQLVLDPSFMRRHAADAATLIRALSNKHRLLILCVLADGELSVGDLNRLVRLSQSALSQHLAVLRREKLVTTRRAAQTIYYKVESGIAMDVVRLLHDHFCGTRPSPRRARVIPTVASPVRAVRRR